MPLFQPHIDALSAGTTSIDYGTVVFSNSNGMSFGMAGNTITGSYTVPTATNATLSAGTQSTIITSIVFSNSNNFSFGLSNNTITASYTVPTLTNSSASISAGASSETLSNLVFSNSNGISFGLNAGTITGTVQTNYLTTAMLSNAGSNFVNTSAGVNLTNISATFNSNSISLSVGNYITTAMASNRGSDFVQATAGFNGTNASGTIASNSWSVSVAAQTNQTVGLYASSNTYLTSSGTVDARSLSFRGDKSITVGVSAGEVVFSVGAYLTTAMASNAGSNFVNTSAGLNLTNISATFNSNSISLSVGNYITTAMASNRGSDFVAATAGFNGTNASGTIASNSWSVSVAAQTNQSLGLYMSSNTTSSVSSGTVDARSLSFRGAGVASVGYSAGEVVISVPAGGGGLTNINLSAGTTSNNLSAVTFSNSNNLSFGLDGSTVTASYLEPFQSYFVNATPSLGGFDAVNVSGSTIYVQPFILPFNMSISYIRIPLLISFGSTTFGTTANSSFYLNQSMTAFANFFTKGAGGNSRSLQYYTGTSVSMVWQVRAEQGAASNDQTISHNFTYPAQGASANNYATNYNVNSATMNISTTHLTSHNGSRWLDIPFEATLSKGVYWVALNRSQATAVTGTQMTAVTMAPFNLFTTLAAFGSMAPFGTVSNIATNSPLNGMGVWSTNTNGTTSSSMAISNISFNSSRGIMFQFIREA